LWLSAVAVDHNAGIGFTAIVASVDTIMSAKHGEIRVYYNSACPVCNAGITYQRRRMRECPVQWRDVHRDLGARREIAADLEFVRERLHAVDEDGRVRSGLDAFEVIWRHSPGEHWKARLIALPLVKPVVTLLYNAFARVLYKWNRWMRHW
jgi:predicted DCC family thiol-disulfide oxidoreductase YuxK